MASLVSAQLPLWQVLLLSGAALVAGTLLGPNPKQVDKAPEKQPESSDNPQVAKVAQQHLKLTRREGAKIVLVVRTDLGMSGGTVAAQCVEATLNCCHKAEKSTNGLLRCWEHEGQAKITLKCRSEEEMQEMQQRAQELGLVTHMVGGQAKNTKVSMVLGIGPGPVSIVDKVTGHLKLY